MNPGARESLAARALRRLDRAAAATAALWLVWAALSARVAFLPGQLGAYALDGEAMLHAVPGGFVQYRMPLSGLLAALLLHWPALPAAAATASCAALALLTAALAARLAPTRTPLLGAAFVFVLLDWGGGYPETPLALMLLCVAALAARCGEERGLRPALLLASCIGATFLFRSSLALLPPLLAAAELADGPSASRRESAARALVLLSVPYLFLLPWIELNWVLSNQHIPFEAGQASSNLVTGALGLIQTVEGDWSVLLRGEADPLSPSTVLAWCLREALSHPARTLSAVVERLWRFAVWNAALVACAAAAAWLRRDSRAFRRALLIAVYFVAAHALMSVEPRYFLPLRPLLAALALSVAARLLAPGPRWEAGWAAVPVAAAAALLAGAVFAEAAVLRYVHVVRSGVSRSARLEAELARRPGDVGLSITRGLDRFAAGDCRGALDDLNVALDGRSFAHRRAWCLGRLGYSSSLLDMEPGDVELGARVELRLLQANLLLSRGQREEASELLREAPRAAVSGRVIRGGAADELRAVGFTRLVSEPGLVAALPVPPREKAALLGELTGPLDGSSPGRAALAEAWLQSARAAARAADRALALDCVRRAELLAGPDGARRVALAYQDMGENERATRTLEGLLAAGPRDAGLYADLGVALFLAGDASRSEAMLQRALALDSGHRSARASLAAVRSLAGRPIREPASRFATTPP